MKLLGFVDEFQQDWQLAGRAVTTGADYARCLRELAAATGDTPSLRDVKLWLGARPTATARRRAQAVRAFGKWSAENDGPDFSWWSRVPLANVPVTAQPTVSKQDYERATRLPLSRRDLLVVELLWCAGLRVSELARLQRADVALTGRFVIVKQSKTNQPRLAPLSDRACRLIRRYDSGTASLLGLGKTGVQQMLKRHDLPPAHAWRRGWAVRSLREGVSETSVRAAAGWKSGAMVARYTAAASAELAIHEFRSKLG
ncbi:MAG TPA: tyrosine-type recombinase/integrase [Ilumatobacter sp.]|nr:tyrosine-type recombinase/integrase [Ilumatobacter sp.]